MSDGTIVTQMAEHPKLSSAVLTVLLLISQSGMVAANGIHGP